MFREELGQGKQMKGRGVRVIDPNDLRAVTDDAQSKDRFILVDCVGVCESDLIDTLPLEKNRGVGFEKLLEAVAQGSTKADQSKCSHLGRIRRTGKQDRHRFESNRIESNRIEERFLISPGDLLFSRANTIDLVGACVITERVTAQIMLSDKILRFGLIGSDPRWVVYMLRSRQGRHDIERLSTGNQESMRNIGQDRIRQIRVPLPPLAEQHRIVAEVDRLLSVADTTEQAVRAQLARARRLRQAVLERAFEGKLVPQDPGDEPASVLLERIQSPEAEPAGANVPAKPAAPKKGKLRAEAQPGGRGDG